MVEERHRVPERLVDAHLLRRVVQVLVAPNDVCDAHVDIVDDHDEVVDERAVGASDDEILELFVVEADVTDKLVVNHRRAGLGDAEPPRAVPFVRGAGAKERFRRLQVSLVTLRLAWPLVPVQPEPAKRGDNLLDRLVGRPLAVRVFDAQHEGAAGVPREQPVEQSRACSPDVEVPGRTRRKPDSNHA